MGCDCWKERLEHRGDERFEMFGYFGARFGVGGGRNEIVHDELEMLALVFMSSNSREIYQRRT